MQTATQSISGTGAAGHPLAGITCSWSNSTHVRQPRELSATLWNMAASSGQHAATLPS